MNLLQLCVFRMSSLCSLLYFLSRSVEAICWTFPQFLTYPHQEQKNNHVAAGSLFAATHRHLLCHCAVSSRCHAVPFSFLPSCPHTCDAVACRCINSRGNRWVFLPGSECCVSPGVSMSGWRHVHCTFDEFTHTRGNSHTLSASSGDRGIKWGKLCGKSSKKKIMQDLYVGFEDDWLGFKTCIHQLMGRGHSGTTPTDSQTLCLGVIFCPHWSLNAVLPKTWMNVSATGFKMWKSD